MAFSWLNFHCVSDKLKVAHDDGKCRRGDPSAVSK